VQSSAAHRGLHTGNISTLVSNKQKWPFIEGTVQKENFQDFKSSTWLKNPEKH